MNKIANLGEFERREERYGSKIKRKIHEEKDKVRFREKSRTIIWVENGAG